MAFVFDCTMEDLRIIAVEHKIPCSKVDHPSGEKGDGTFDVLHIHYSGRTLSLNLSQECLAKIMYVGLSGDDSESTYDSKYVKEYQAKIGSNHDMSFIP